MDDRAEKGDSEMANNDPQHPQSPGPPPGPIPGPSTYPAINQAAPGPYPAAHSFQQPFAPYPPQTWQAPPQIATEVQAHAHQFYNQYGPPPTQDTPWRFPGRDGVGYGVPGQAPPPGYYFPHAYPTPMDPEGESIDGRPMQNEFFNPGDMPGNEEIVYDPMSRGRNELRGGGRGRGEKRKRGWRQMLKGTEHEALFQKEKAPRESTRGRGRGKGKRSRPVDPGHEFKIHQGEATKAHLEGNFEEALGHARRAVQANPEIFAAHSLMSEILAQLGREQDALAALMNGALATTKDSNVWTMCAERTLQYAGENRTNDLLDQALWCYSMAIQNDKENYDARASKLYLYLEMGNESKARLESKNMLKQRPFDVDNVRQYAELCASTEDGGELLRAKIAYEKAFDHHISSSENFGDESEQWSHLNVYLEILDRVGTPAEGVSQMKRLARWFLGRREEEFWDRYTMDDREFDSGHDRRGFVGEFQQGRASVDMEKYGDGLPLELRVKMGIFRLKMGPQFHDEALKHFDHLLQLASDIGEYYDIFFLVAENLREHRLYSAAIGFYEPILRVPDVANEELHTGLGECYVSTQRPEDAKAAFQKAIEFDKNQIEARVELAKLYEHDGRKDDALSLVKEVIQLGRKDLVTRENLPMPVQKVALKRKPVRSRRDGAPPGYMYVDDIGSGSDEEAAGERPRKLIRIVPKDGAEGEDELDEDGRPVRARRPVTYSTRRPYRKMGEKISKRIEFDEAEIRPIRDQMSGIHSDYAALQELWPSLDEEADGEITREWMEIANRMLTTFRSMAVFYPKRGGTKERLREFTGYGKHSATARVLDEMEIMRKRLLGTENDEADGPSEKPPDPTTDPDLIPKDFCDISFSEWQRIFIELALIHARFGDQEACYDVLKEGLSKANVFMFDPILNNTTHSAGIACALTFNDSAYLNDIARKYITLGEFRSGATYQLIGALSTLCHGPNYYSAGPPQKFMLRAIKMLDHIRLPAPIRAKFNWSNQGESLDKRLARYGPSTAPLDAGALMHYGHQVSTANHSASALPYFFRAYALQPRNVVVLLSIGTMMLQNAMKRQTGNRQYGISQGMSFMYAYYGERVKSGKAVHRQEAEYNVARAYHALGLGHLAVEGYEKVLALSEDVAKENEGDAVGEVGGWGGREDYAPEAALCLQGLFCLSGNYGAAREVGERWLVM